jgi:hypothetical protein
MSRLHNSATATAGRTGRKERDQINKMIQGTPLYAIAKRRLLHWRAPKLRLLAQQAIAGDPKLPNLGRIHRRSRKALICWFCESLPEVIHWSEAKIEATINQDQRWFSLSDSQISDNADLFFID